MKTRTIVASALLIALLGGLLPGATVSWTSGTSGPSSWGLTPGSPTTADTISFRGPLNAASYGNSCAAEAALGGTPQITIDTTNRVIDLTFTPPAPTMCTMIYMPVCGLEGTFGPLTAGKWTFRCLTLSANITFTVTSSGGSGGTVIYVDRSSPGPVRDGTTWARAFLYLQDALAIPGTSNEIRMADGTYQPDQGAGQTSGSRLASFNVQNGVTIKGGHAGYGASNPNARDLNAYPTILTGDLGGNDLWGILNRSDNSYHVVTVSGDAKLDGLTIRSGQADGPYPHFYGGGVYAVGGHLTVSRCTLRANTALYGGALGGLVSSSYFANCNISGNRAYLFGGGVYNEDGGVNLVNCLLTGNSAGSSGLGGGSALCTIGGFAAYALLTNCTLADNVGPNPNSIVVLNLSLAGGAPGASTTFNNSILYNSGGASLIWTNDTTEVAANYSIIQGGLTGLGNLDADPLFVQRGMWSIEGEWIDTSANYSLPSTSPAVNAGKTSLLPSDVADVDGDGNTTETIPIDLAGANRVQSTAVDMGAYESSSSGGGGGGYAWVPLTTFTLTIDVPSGGFSGPITVNSGTISYPGTSGFKAELMLGVVPVALTGGNWTATFSPSVTTVGPGSFTVSFYVTATNVAAQLLTPGATNVTLATVTMYARPSP